MKRAFKIIVPILLVIAVIGSIGWYLFKFDPAFTRDFLLRQARSAEDRGNHSFAAWIYGLTYRQSQGDENIAIELAEQFKSVGNYTKAEYTLSNAIADGGSAQLYIALCKTYVEQDKLLDAVTMLDNIADPQIKAQLDAIRPAAPVATPESGYFNQYINVSYSKADGAIYYSTDSEYPSTKNAPFTGELELPGGETTIYALCVNKDGLVSPLSIQNYTIAGVIEEVSITDPALGQIIRQVLGVTDDHKLYSNELWSITELEITNEVTSLEDLSKLSFLEKLSIPAGDYENISTISSLPSLHTLQITGVTLNSDEISAIGALPKLQNLSLSQCNLSTVAGLASAVSLKSLDLSHNTLRDLSPLKELKNLQSLILSHNAISNLENLSGLTKLEILDLSNNAITSSAPLASCTALKNLQLSNNKLIKLEGLDKLNGLTTLAAESNKLTDINHLGTCTELTQLDISDNKVEDLTPISSMPKLLKLDFSNNRVEQLPKLASKNVITEINGAYNRLTSLKELENQTNLNYVIMDYNNNITSVVPLRNCYSLVEVSVYGTGVTDISALTSMNIIVRYSPISMD